MEGSTFDPIDVGLVHVTCFSQCNAGRNGTCNIQVKVSLDPIVEVNKFQADNSKRNGMSVSTRAQRDLRKSTY